MAKWKNGYKSMPNIGVYGGTYFQPAEVQAQWNYLYNTYEGINRVLALDAPYYPNPDYKGGVCASGAELSWSDVLDISTNSATPTVLCGLRMGTESTSPILVMKAYRGALVDRVQTKTIDINVDIYKRVYTDGSTFNDTFVSRCFCRAIQPNAGDVSSSHTWLEFLKYNNTWLMGIDNYFVMGNEVKSLWQLWNPEQTAFENVFGNKSPESTQPKSDEFGPAAEPGGGYVPGGGAIPGDGSVIKEPTFDNSSDKIEISTKPTLSAISAKFLHAYVVTEQSLEYIGDALFPQPVFQQPDLITAMGELAQIIFFNKQVDYMLDLLILPIDVPHGNWEPLNVGGRQLSTVIGGTTYFINGQPAYDCYVDVTCGSISIDEYWVNFLDFAGTKVKLFLPYIGYVDIQPEYVIGGTLYVDYRFNILDGSFMAYVRSDSGYSELEESLVCQYAGVAAVHVPLQSKDYSAKISGLISAIGTVGAGAVSGGIGAAAAAGATANAANTIVQKPGTSHANGYNASSSFLSHRKPYLIIERQWSQFSQKYPEEVGMPSNVMCRLGDLYGLVKSANAHLDVIPCSVEGKEKISQLLAAGIIL